MEGGDNESDAGCNWIVASSKNTLTHSAAMERFSASVLKSLQSRGVKIEAFKRNGCALGCRSLSGKKENMESIKIHLMQLICLINNKACNCVSLIKATSADGS